ncbi:F510_1955 family glycosylhydrolase [Micromonospora halophytica]|uniref:BNR/Asp-box repeat-containing protein n=1 Tax=Micromonospora halophytica TaxID=47864 RepID=A0A1C5HJI2_9ACTN|nr:exo-alpha-sialidase [Micromonospora halophytica]SCG46154.1 BNR/Asp-box repeat-containing protein [Micromonospora halophytica]
MTRGCRTKWLGAVLAAALALTGCTGPASPSSGPTPPSSGASPSSSGPTPTGDGEEFGHVHGLGVNPRDGQLYAATHHGVFRITGSGPTRVGEGRQDTMGFTVTGPDEFLASGHPAHGEAGPAHLGLIGSTDAGRTWRTLSLAGEADFHLLRQAGDTVYGLDSTSGALMASADRATWERRARVEADDLAVDPARPDTLLVTGEQGVRRSTDGGRTWSPVGGPAVLLLHWSTRELVGVAADGQILRSTDAAASWTPTGGRATDAPVALTAHEGRLYLATRDARVLRSDDAGKTWHPVAS